MGERATLGLVSGSPAAVLPAPGGEAMIRGFDAGPVMGSARTPRGGRVQWWAGGPQDPAMLPSLEAPTTELAGLQVGHARGRVISRFVRPRRRHEDRHQRGGHRRSDARLLAAEGRPRGAARRGGAPASHAAVTSSTSGVVGYDIAEKMGLIPRLRELGYQVREVRFVDRHGRTARRLLGRCVRPPDPRPLHQPAALRPRGHDLRCAGRDGRDDLRRLRREHRGGGRSRAGQLRSRRPA